MAKAKYSLEARRSYGIYAIVNTVTGRTYIGRAGFRFSERWAMHCVDLRKGRHRNKALQRDWDQYGSDVFEFRILEKIDQGHACHIDLAAAERRHIANATGPLYNERERKNTHWLLG